MSVMSPSDQRAQKHDLYIFIGPPGSGKGSLADLCVRELAWRQLSTGNVCRHHISRQTEIGKQIDFAIKSGKLVSDSLIVSMVADWFDEYLTRCPAVILDGFPRTVPQAQAFTALLNNQFGAMRAQVIQLDISDEGVVQRLCSRFICENNECQAVYSLAPDSALAPKKAEICDVCSGRLARRKDDDEATVRERLAGYHRHERALVDYYKTLGEPIRQLPVEKPLQEVFKDFKQIIGLEN